MHFWGLYAIADSEFLREEDFLARVTSAIKGGARAVQLRDKRSSARFLVKRAEALVKLTRSYGIKCIINDRLDIALAVNADGVHLGQDDMPPGLARKVMGSKYIIGVSADTPQEVHSAVKAGADYLGVGAVYATATKADAGKPLGLSGLRAICSLSPIPVVAIGGINAANAGSVMEAGARGAAVISALFGSSDVEKAARDISRALEAKEKGQASRR